MFSTPTVEERGERPYVAIRTLATMAELPVVMPQLHDEVFGWLARRGIAPAGAPFIRYHVIDMAGQLDIALGVPVARAVPGDGRVYADTLPPGRYAALVYTDVRQGIPANGALLRWGAEQGLTWDAWSTPQGDAFGARLETFLTEPDDEPDPAKWETEVAIRLKS